MVNPSQKSAANENMEQKFVENRGQEANDENGLNDVSNENDQKKNDEILKG